MKNPFEQVKELTRMQKEAKEMERKMKNISVTGTSKDSLVSITINGTQELEDMAISDSLLSIDSKRQLLKDIRQAYESMQRELKKEMMKGFDMSKLKDLLG
jgi:DNA-binding protein YbaB